jgi:hypothetical protein
MRPSLLRGLSWAVALLLAFPFPSEAIDTPLSDTAVREAYFLGQRHDETFALFLDKYTFHLPQPEKGPYVESITLLTPFAMMVEYSSKQLNYSAQQAQIDHKKMPEIVRVEVQIVMTESYGPYLMRPTGSRSGSPFGIELRPANFWQDFRVRLFQEDQLLKPLDSSGHPIYRCDDYGGCILSGAVIQFIYPAESFTGKSAIAQIDLPEGQGDPISVEFDLTALR